MSEERTIHLLTDLNIVGAVLLSLCILVLMLGAILVFCIYTFNRFAQEQVVESRKFAEQFMLMLKAPNAVEAVNATSTLEHNREALRQGRVAFDSVLAQDSEEKSDKMIVEDQLTGRKIEVIT